MWWVKASQTASGCLLFQLGQHHLGHSAVFHIHYQGRLCMLLYRKKQYRTCPSSEKFIIQESTKRNKRERERDAVEKYAISVDQLQHVQVNCKVLNSLLPFKWPHFRNTFMPWRGCQTSFAEWYLFSCFLPPAEASPTTSSQAAHKGICRCSRRNLPKSAHTHYTKLPSPMRFSNVFFVVKCMTTMH